MPQSSSTQPEVKQAASVLRFSECVFGRTLVLQSRGLTDPDIVDVILLLNSNPLIDTVNLNDNRFTAQGALYFAKFNNSARTVDLSHNQIGPQGILRFLKKNRTAITVISYGNDITDAEITAFLKTGKETIFKCFSTLSLKQRRRNPLTEPQVSLLAHNKTIEERFKNRNCAWASFGFMLAFMSANKDNPVKNSFQDLVPLVTALAGFSWTAQQDLSLKNVRGTSYCNSLFGANNLLPELKAPCSGSRNWMNLGFFASPAALIEEQKCTSNTLPSNILSIPRGIWSIMTRRRLRVVPVESSVAAESSSRTANPTTIAPLPTVQVHAQTPSPAESASSATVKVTRPSFKGMGLGN